MATTPRRPFAELGPEERMQRRFPQKVRVGDLVGLPVLDFDDRTLGHVQDVVQTGDGKIRLVVPFGGWFGFGRRLVGVPIEVVAIAGRQIAALDMTRDEFNAAPVWKGDGAKPIPKDDIIRIALYKR